MKFSFSFELTGVTYSPTLSPCLFLSLSLPFFSPCQSSSLAFFFSLSFPVPRNFHFTSSYLSPLTQYILLHPRHDADFSHDSFRSQGQTWNAPPPPPPLPFWFNILTTKPGRCNPSSQQLDHSVRFSPYLSIFTTASYKSSVRKTKQCKPKPYIEKTKLLVKTYKAVI